VTSLGRTYNQTHVARHYDGRRRISLYWTWNYPWEVQRDPAAADNRFSTVTEVRNALWPAYETERYDARNFLQGIAGTLELFHISALAFQRAAEEETGHPVAVYQRVDQAGFRQPIDGRVLDDCDTLLVFGLDHLAGEEHADPAEAAAIRDWLRREGTCLVLAPHHDVGFTEDFGQRQEEYLHHGDPLVPRQQRFTSFVRDLMEQLDVPVRNIWGLRPARRDGAIAPLTRFPELDELGLLDGVPTLNFHPHLPHYEVLEDGASRVRILACQPIDPDRPHPFTRAGNSEFNILLWMPPEADRRGDILLVDSTHLTTQLGGTESLDRFWRNLARMEGSRVTEPPLVAQPQPA
jgi:hypothetical protein